MDRRSFYRPSFIQPVLGSLTTEQVKKEVSTERPRHLNRGPFGPVAALSLSMSARLQTGLGRISGFALPVLLPSDL